MLYFFCSSLLGALSGCNNVSESQVHSLLRVVVAGMRSNSRDFFSLGAILAARVLPRVALRARVADRLLRVLGKTARREGGVDTDTLALFLVVYRSQQKVANKSRALALLARHEQVVVGAVFQDSDVAFAAKVMATLASMCEGVAGDPNPTAQVLCLLRCVKEGLERVEPDYDSAIKLIKAVSKAHQAFKTIKKGLKAKKDREAETKRTCKTIIGECKAVLGILKAKYPVEYLEHSLVQTEDVDIMFMGGGEGSDDSLPTHAEVTAKRILLDDELVAAASREFLTRVIARTDRSAGYKTMRKESARAVGILFGSVEPSFLLRHHGGARMARLTVNMLSTYGRKSSVAGPVVRFACSREFCEDEEVEAELGEGFDLQLALLPFLTLVGSEWKAVLKEAKCGWFVNHRAPLLRSALATFPEEGAEDFKATNKILLGGLKRSMDAPELVRIAKAAVGDPRHHDPALFSLLVCLITDWLGAARCDKKTASELASAGLDLLSTACAEMELQDKTGEGGDGDDDPGRLLFLARVRRCFPEELVEITVRKMAERKDLAASKAVLTKMLSFGCALKKKKTKQLAAASLISLEAFDSLVGRGEAMEAFALDAFAAEDEATPKNSTLMKLYCGKKLLNQVTSSKECRRRTLGFRSATFPKILAVLAGSNARVARVAFSILVAAVGDDGEQDSAQQHQTYRPFCRFLVDRRETLVDSSSSSVNLETAVRQFLEGGGKAGEACIRSLVNRVTSSVEELPTFVRLESFLAYVTHPTEIASLAEFGLRLLKDVDKEEAVSCRALEVLLRRFMPSFLANMDRRPCLDFILACAVSPRTVDFANMRERVAVLALRNLRGAPLPDCGTFFGALVKLSLEVEDGGVLSECRGVIKELPVDIDMFSKVLEDTLESLEDRSGGEDARRRKAAPTTRYQK